MWPSPQPAFNVFISPQALPPPHPALALGSTGRPLTEFALSGHFLKMEPSRMRPSMTGFFHSAWCFQGSCGSLDQNSIPFHGRINQYFFNECFIHFSWFLLLVLEYITVTHLKNTCGFEYLYYIFLFVFLLVNSTVLMGIKQYRSIQSKIQIIPSTQTTTLHSSVFLCPYIFLHISPNIQTSLTSCLTLRSVKKKFHSYKLPR